MAIRPKTLPAAVAPIAVGTSLALSSGAFRALPALAALLVALFLQVGTNLANGYSDYVKGADHSGRKGPTRASQSGLIPLAQMRFAAGLCFLATVLNGSYLVWLAGWPVLLVGIAAVLSGPAYTGGPFPLGYHGLGDLFVFLFFGLAAVSGTYYVQSFSFAPLVFAACVPVGALTVAILVVNNLRDIASDRQARKFTLPVILGPRATRWEYALLFAVAYLVPGAIWLAGWTTAWTLLPWLTLPIAIQLCLTIFRTAEGPPLNQALARTAQLDLLFSLLFSIGLLL